MHETAATFFTSKKMFFLRIFSFKLSIFFIIVVKKFLYPQTSGGRIPLRVPSVENVCVC